MTDPIRITVIPGDGVGREVTPVALDVLDAVADRHDLQLELTEVDWGCQRCLEEGQMAPEGWLDELRYTDAILLGAVGYSGVPDHISLWDLLIPSGASSTSTSTFGRSAVSRACPAPSATIRTSTWSSCAKTPKGSTPRSVDECSTAPTEN